MDRDLKRRVVGDSNLPLPSRMPRWLVAILMASFLGAALGYAYFTIFSRFTSYDDEGYLMLSVQSFLGGHALYDQVFSQYGPLYYFYEWWLHAVAGLPLTHDATRLLCLCHWIVAALCLGVAAGKLMRSALGGLLVFTQAVVHLTPMANEPGHPQELTVLLMALASLVVVSHLKKPVAIAALGMIAAALVFTKINVGAFFCFATATTLLSCAQGPLFRGLFLALIPLTCAMPFLLMRAHLSDARCQNYCIISAAGIAAAMLVLWRRNPARFLRARHVLAGALGFSALSALILISLHWRGTSLVSLLHGLLLEPARFPKLVWNPMPIPSLASANAIAAVLAAWLFSRNPKRAGVPEMVLVLKAAFGLIGCFLLVRYPFPQLVYLLPWSWLALVPPRPQMAGLPVDSSRSFLVLLAAWQSLQAYPVTGTQVALATLFCVVLYALCLSDVFRSLIQSPSLAKTARPPALWNGVALAILLCLFVQPWGHLPARLKRYATLTPLNLPGSHLIRLRPDEAQLYQDIASYVAANCDVLLTAPGINSFHFWSNKPPPTQFNATAWMLLLNDPQQGQILAALRQSKRAAILIHEPWLAAWRSYYDFEQKPLLRYLRNECHPITRLGPWDVYIPNSRLDPAVPQ